MSTESPTTFEHDLVVHIQHVNPRTEMHGEDEVLAVDVKVRLMMGEVGTEWDAVLASLIGSASIDIADLTPIFKSLPFAADFENHKANFRISTKVIATLVHAKINKFVLECEDIGITFRIQAEADGRRVGALSELIGQKARLEIVPMQGELDLARQEETAEA